MRARLSTILMKNRGAIPVAHSAVGLRGFSSETFAYEAIAAREGDDRPYYYVYYLGDFDRAGRDGANSLEEKLQRFAGEEGIDLVFEQIAVTEQQIIEWNLPT